MFGVYDHIVGYLYRWVIIRVGRYGMRLHRIVDCDRTRFVHSHPFSYVSVVLMGGYSERVLVGDGELEVVDRYVGSVVVRGGSVYHRIDRVWGRFGCITLFFVRDECVGDGQGWGLKEVSGVGDIEGERRYVDGIYRIGNKFRKMDGGVWYVLSDSEEGARGCTRISIRQHIEFVDGRIE